MPKLSGDFDPGEYAPVAERIQLFYQAYPRGQINSRLVSQRDGRVTFVAEVYRSPNERRPSATGWASEREGDGEVNTSACVENTETSAIGRALANLGFTASRLRPSREEMEKAGRALERARRATSDKPPEAAATPPRVPPINSVLQERADRATDMLALIRTSERYGLRPARAERMRQQVLSGASNEDTMQSLARVLRRWIARRLRDEVSRPPQPASESYSGG